MTEAVEYEQFEDTTQPAEGLDAGTDLRRLSEVPMELSVEIGRTRMTVGETLELRAGSIVTLDRPAGEPVDLLVNGTPIAHGEVVVVDEQFGLRVKEILDVNEVPARAASDHRSWDDAGAIDGQGTDGQIDGHGMDGHGMDGQAMDGQAMEGQAIEAQATGDQSGDRR